MSDLSIEELETYYDYLADAIDAVGEDKAGLFLTKVCLLNFNSTRDLEAAMADIDSAKVFYE